MKYFMLLCIHTFLMRSYAQSNFTSDAANVTKLTILNPGISYEKRIGRLQTISTHVHMSLSAYFGYSSAFGEVSSVKWDPGLGIHYRYYYNAERRTIKGKRTEMNSMNYLSITHGSFLVKRFIYDSAFYKTKLRLVNTLGIVWGMQRNYPRRFSVDLNVGLGYSYGKKFSFYNGGDPNGLILLAGIDIGLWLNKRK